jgi:hypothetical protein
MHMKENKRAMLADRIAPIAFTAYSAFQDPSSQYGKARLPEPSLTVPDAGAGRPAPRLSENKPAALQNMSKPVIYYVNSCI